MKIDITGIRVGDGLDEESSSESITEFRYTEDDGGDLYATKSELVELIKTTEGCVVHAVGVTGARTKVAVINPRDSARQPFLRTVGDRLSSNDLIDLPRF